MATPYQPSGSRKSPASGKQGVAKPGLREALLARRAKGEDAYRDRDTLKKLGVPARGSATDEVKKKLDEAGIDPILEITKLLKSGKVGENMQVRALEILVNLIHAKQRPQDAELEELKRRLAEGQRFVLLGEQEDESGEKWAARNAWRVPSPPPVPLEEQVVPEGVVPS